MSEGKKPNRLIKEKSPYLLQHAFNPVDWYPWGEEAFEKARREDKPIFLSIGYSTCYWCHVMEREVFKDTAIARLMNEALAAGREAALLYRQWMISSDARRDPQAYVLTPSSAITIAQAIVSAPDSYAAGKAAAFTALRLLREAHRDGALRIHPRELPWFDRLQASLEALPASEAAFIDEMMAEVDTTKFVAADYELG